MQILYLNFPIFYRIVVKGNTGFRQNETVNLLLLGKLHSERNERELSASVVSNYVAGRKRISAYLLSAITSCTDFELERRFRRLGLHNLDASIQILTASLDKFSNIDSSARDSLMQKTADRKHPYAFLIHLFRIALTCPASGYHTITKAELSLIASLRPSDSKNGIFFQTSSSHDIPVAAAAADANPELYQQPGAPLNLYERQTLETFKDSIPVTQMKLRPLNLPEDIAPAVNYLFESGAGEVIPAAKRDFENILSGLDKKSTAILVEYYGNSQQILFACRSVPYLRDCIYLLILVEENTDLENSDIGAITSALEAQCPYEADIQTAVYHAEKQTVPLRVRLLYVVA